MTRRLSEGEWDMECPGCGARWLNGVEKEWHGIPCQMKTLVRRHADPALWKPKAELNDG